MDSKNIAEQNSQNFNAALPGLVEQIQMKNGEEFDEKQLKQHDQLVAVQSETRMTEWVPEAHVLMRLPYKEAELVKKYLNEGTISQHVSVFLAFNQLGNAAGNVCVDGHELAFKMVNLPTLIEAQKSEMRGQLLKVGDIHQMMICDEQSESDDKDTELESGITPPMQNAKNQFKNSFDDILKEAGKLSKSLNDIFLKNQIAEKVTYEVTLEGFPEPIILKIKDTTNSLTDDKNAAFYDVMEDLDLSSSSDESDDPSK